MNYLQLYKGTNYRLVAVSDEQMSMSATRVALPDQVFVLFRS